MLEYLIVCGRWDRMSRSLVALGLCFVLGCSGGAGPHSGTTTRTSKPGRMEQRPVPEDTLIRVLYHVHWQGLFPIACARGREFLDPQSELCVDIIPPGTAIKDIDAGLVGVTKNVRQREEGDPDCEIGPCVAGGEIYVSMENVSLGKGRSFAVWPQDMKTTLIKSDSLSADALALPSVLNTALLREAKEVRPDIDTKRVEHVRVYEVGDEYQYLIVNYDSISASYFQKNGGKLEAHHFDGDSITSWSPRFLLDLNGDGRNEIVECGSDATNDRWATVMSIVRARGRTRGSLQYGCE